MMRCIRFARGTENCCVIYCAQIRRLLINTFDPKLHLRANCHLLADWLNTDIEQGGGTAFLDATKPFPFEAEAEAFARVRGKHMISHI
jgi:hypothetical protein